eukprot:523861-Amphidinium_carterae.1
MGYEEVFLVVEGLGTGDAITMVDGRPVDFMEDAEFEALLDERERCHTYTRAPAEKHLLWRTFVFQIYSVGKEKRPLQITVEPDILKEHTALEE